MTDEEKSRVNYLIKEMCYQNPYAVDELESIMHKVLFCYLKKFYHDESLIEDVISETFDTVIEKCKTRIFFINCSSWMMQIAKFKLCNYTRKNKNEVPYESIENTLCSFEEDSDHKLTVEYILKSLNEKHKQLFCLRFLNGEKIKTIAKCMKISERTVDREIAILKEKIEKEFDLWTK